MTSRAGTEEATFHLVVPIYHGDPGLTWTEGHVRGVAPDKFMTHLAVTEGDTEWGDHLTNGEYPNENP